MISRILIPVIIAIVLPDLYFDTHYLNRRTRMTWWKRLLWWLPGMLMLAYTIGLASLRGFVPDDLRWMNVYLVLLGLFVFPKALLALCSASGLLYCRIRHTHHNWGNAVGLLLGIFSVYILFYGSTFGFLQLEEDHQDLYFKDLPPSFDGYRMAVFSDAHVGTYQQPSDRKTLQRALEKINSLQADAILFLGDLQNIQPSELYPFQGILSSLKAKDGVFSVLGNHDYSQYIAADPAVKIANEKETISRERQFGWTLLLNEHRVIRRGRDSIVIAGEENDGWRPRVIRADLQKTLAGVSDKAFVVMLQHDPSQWRRAILPKCNAQLTLSGHTHGGQFSLFGWRPTMFAYHEDKGLYLDHGRALYVSAGLGGLLHFRFGVPPQITLITLHQLK